MVCWRRKWWFTSVFLLSDPHEQYGKVKRYDPRRCSPRSEGVHYATGEELRAELIAPERMKQLGQSRNDTQLWMCLVVKLVLCYNEQFCIETWNVRSKNQGKLDMVKQEIHYGCFMLMFYRNQCNTVKQLSFN